MIDQVEFSKNLQNEIKFYSRYFRFPIKAEILENLLYEALNRENTWKPGSHSSGPDVGNWSIKSGKISKRKGEDILTFSSYRLTSAKTIEEKLKMINQRSEDIQLYYFLSTRKDKEKEYSLLTISKSGLELNSSTIIENKKGWDLTGKHDGVKARITKCMSDQLWYEISLKRNKDIILIKTINTEGLYIENIKQRQEEIQKIISL